MDILRRINWQLCAAAMLLAASAFGVQGVQAATTDISTVPLGTAPTTSVLPNLMFVLDNSEFQQRHSALAIRISVFVMIHTIVINS